MYIFRINIRAFFLALARFVAKYGVAIGRVVLNVDFYYIQLCLKHLGKNVTFPKKFDSRPRANIQLTSTARNSFTAYQKPFNS